MQRTRERFETAVDSARAVYKGYLICGDRRSLEYGQMIWALPGGGYSATAGLQESGAFEIIVCPPDRELRRYADEEREKKLAMQRKDKSAQLA